jgi:hypothetical protein
MRCETSALVARSFLVGLEKTRMRLSLVLASTVLMGACSSSSPTGNSSGQQTSQGSICNNDPRGMTYAIGLSATSANGLMKASFRDATPAPPAKNENSWTLKLTDAHGNPITGATLAVVPFMPDHGHGPPAQPLWMEMGGGSYIINQIDFFMPGIWQVTFTITPTLGPADSLVFTFCVDG